MSRIASCGQHSLAVNGTISSSSVLVAGLRWNTSSRAGRTRIKCRRKVRRFIIESVQDEDQPLKAVCKKKDVEKLRQGKALKRQVNQKQRGLRQPVQMPGGQIQPVQRQARQRQLNRRQGSKKKMEVLWETAQNGRPRTWKAHQTEKALQQRKQEGNQGLPLSLAIEQEHVEEGNPDFMESLSRLLDDQLLDL